MKDILEKLSGWKTYICVFIIAVLSVMKHYGVMDVETFNTAMFILSSAAIASLRSGIKKSEKASQEATEELQNFKGLKTIKKLKGK